MGCYVLFQPCEASAVDVEFVYLGRDVGQGAVFSREGAGQLLPITEDGGAFLDRPTGSRWTILGQALEGSLKGQSLTPIHHTSIFWFAWDAFYPEALRTDRFAGGRKSPDPQ